MRLYDTLARRKREFRPLEGNKVRIYTCGPSVYNYSHIGNFRTYLFEDVLVRYLRFKGYRVRRVMNITDVEDKAIAAARREGIPLMQLESDKTKRFFSDFKNLGMIMPDVVAKASMHVPQMIRLIKKICRNGYCINDKGTIYFNVRKLKGYGKLRRLASHRYFGRAKGDDYYKEGLWDFILWKRWTKGDGDAKWKSPFGYGRPGWHIECSAMSMHYLGDTFDIHCGGSDNIFPHHENEIAQSYAATGKPLANFWLHAKHLTIGKRKMSKRTGNVLYVKELERNGAKPKCLRFYLISERYRSRLDFTMQRFRRHMQECSRLQKAFAMLKKARGKGRRGASIARRLLNGFVHAMDDDLNTRLAFRRIFSSLREAETLCKANRLSQKDAKAIIRAMERIDSVLGVL